MRVTDLIAALETLRNEGKGHYWVENGEGTLIADLVNNDDTESVTVN